MVSHLVDRSSLATDLVDALDCVFSSLTLCENGPSGRKTVFAAGMGAEKPASCVPALNYFAMDLRLSKTTR
jgi:hypothetical protein